MSAKYPRTHHLPWSPGASRDDKMMASVDGLINADLVITEKLDGSNLALTAANVFARSHSGPPHHPSFHYAKAIHAAVRHQIPPNTTIFCEYCFAVHSIEYTGLPEYLFVFGVRDDHAGHWLSWEEVEQTAAGLNLPTVPVLWRGSVRSAKELQQLTDRLCTAPSAYGPHREGVVVRTAGAFTDAQFATNVGKWVRAGHVTSSEHWMFETIRQQPRA